MTPQRQRLLDSLLLALAMLAIFAGGYFTARHQLQAADPPPRLVVDQARPTAPEKKRNPEEQRRFENWQNNAFRRMSKILELRDDQKPAVKKLLAQSQEEIGTIRHQAQGEVRAVLNKTRNEIAELLDEEQKERFERSRNRVRKVLEHRPRKRERGRDGSPPRPRGPQGQRPPRPRNQSKPGTPTDR